MESPNLRLQCLSSFVSKTPHGALAGKLKELEIKLTKLSKEKVKIVERFGFKSDKKVEDPRKT